MDKNRIIFFALICIMGIIGYTEKSYGTDTLVLRIESQKNCVSYENKFGVCPATIQLQPNTTYSVSLQGSVKINDNGIEEPQELREVYVCYNTQKNHEKCSFITKDKPLQFTTPAHRSEFEAWLYSTETTLYNTGSYDLVFKQVPAE